MAKKKIEEEVVEETDLEELASVSEAVKGEVEEEVKVKKEVFPTCSANGRFQCVKVKGGCVVFNPKGQRATGVITEDTGRNLVREYNRAIGIKVKED